MYIYVDINQLKHDLVLFRCLVSYLVIQCQQEKVKLTLKFNHGLLRAETLGQNLKIRNRKFELGLYTCYVYFI